MSTKKVAPYKNHRAGSRKGSVHKCYDNKGADKAISYGKMRGIQSNTLRSWISGWRRQSQAA